jgi:conjugal transfer pilus assembly protein TraF
MASKRVFLLAALVVAGVARADLYERSPDSWVWYQDPAKEEKAKPRPEVKGQVASPAQGGSAKETLKLMGEQLEEAEAQAVLNPTTENIVRSMTMKKQLLALSQTYADRVEQVVWKNPNLDYTLEKPMRTDALFTANPVKQEKLQEALRSAAQTHALVYVFRSDCPYCKKLSPVLKAFAEQHGFTVLTFTLDGRGTDDFPYPKTDIRQLQAKGMVPQVVPAVYLVDPRQDTPEAVGFGLMNRQDLENRVALAAGINIYEGVASAGLGQQ